MTRAYLKTKFRVQQWLEGRERGASTIEYFGVIVVAVLLITALITVFSKFDLGAKVDSELSKIHA